MRGPRAVGVWLTVAILAGCVGCTGSSTTGRTASGRPTAPTSTTGGYAAVCPRPSRVVNTATDGPEVTGTGHGATLYGLLMASTPPPLRVGQVKIVWRMTGNGPLRLSVTDPRGRPARLTFGPELHSGSSYSRPGQEWGAGYSFPVPGCWHLHAQRTRGSADVFLQVAAA